MAGGDEVVVHRSLVNTIAELVKKKWNGGKKKLTWTKRCQNQHLLPLLPLTVRHPSFVTHSTCSLFKIVVSRIKNKKKWKKLTCGPRDVDIDVSWAPFCHLPFVVRNPGVGVVRCHCFEVVGQMGVDAKSSDGKGVWNYSLSSFHMTSLPTLSLPRHLQCPKIPPWR